MNTRATSFHVKGFAFVTMLTLLVGLSPLAQVQAKPFSQTSGSIASQSQPRVNLPAAVFAGLITFSVNSNLDQPDDLTIPGTCHTSANTCTLRAAVMQANRTSGAGATILLPAGLFKLTIPAAGADGEANGDLNLTSPASGNPIITLLGAGNGKTIIDANQLDRVMHVSIGRTASITGVIIQNGFLSTTKSRGGGIYNEGILTLNSVTLRSNSVTCCGGGISNNGTLNVINTTISQNAAPNGGGIEASGVLNISGSTIVGNTGTEGAGIFNQGNLIMRNSTISGNQATLDGGGIFNFNNAGLATANVYNSSIVFNEADANQTGGWAGGVYNQSPSTFNIRNTLIAGNNVSGAPIYEDCNGIINLYGMNMFWDLTGCTVNTASGTWNYLNSLNLIDPLKNNGGPTFTHALLPGSNAIDAADPVLGCLDANSAPLAKDQRGAARVTGVRCDVGAFEYVPAIKLDSNPAGDGWVLETSESSNLGGSLNSTTSTFRLGDDAARKQYRGILSFNTGAALPDNAIINSLTLSIKQQSVAGSANPVSLFHGFMLDIKKGVFGTLALEPGDFQAVGSKTYGPFSPVLAGGWYVFNLSSAKTYVNALAANAGQTQLRVRFNLDDNNNALANYLSLFSGNAPLGSRPQLVIEYYVP